MSKFRKKPVVIEAWRYEPMSGEFFQRMPIWLAQAYEAKIVTSVGNDYRTRHIEIKTLEGDVKCMQGDWIIRGVQGELYPCKDDIFKRTYEAVFP